MIASLMMYARPELDGAHERFWTLIREQLAARGVQSPEHLSQSTEMFDVWEDPDLVLSQTCGMPYRLFLKDKVTLVGTLDYGLEGCPAGHYKSAIVVQRDDPRQRLEAFKDATFAYNQTHSQSGFAAPYAHTSKLGFWFQNRTETGSHLASSKAVADGRAEIAALDGVTWRLIQDYEAFVPSLRVLEWTDPTPGLPLITAATQDADTIFDSVSDAIDRLEPNDRKQLGIRSLVRIPKSTYLAVPNPPQE